MRTLYSALALLLLTLTASPPAAAQEGGEDDGPLVFVHYMPWYQAPTTSGYWGYHWTFNYFNPTQIGADGQREIASQFYPEIGPYDSKDPDVLEYHALLMRVAGVDGVIADWYGTGQLYDYPLIDQATGALFDAMGEAGLQFAICYEDATLRQLVSQGVIEAGTERTQARADLDAVAQRWAGGDQYLTYDGAPVVLNFGPQVLRQSADWEFALAGFEPAATFLTEDNRLAPAADGAYPWPPMYLSGGRTLTPAALNGYLNQFYAKAADWPLTVGGAWPGFHDIYAEAGVRASYGFLDDRDGATFAETFQRAVDSGVPIIQVATWNDFGEGTIIEPTVEFGTRYLEQIQTAVRGWRAMPFSVDDLALPLRLYRLRQSRDGDPAADAQLDQAAAAIAAGDPTTARGVLDGFATATVSPVEPVALAVTAGPNPARGRVAVAVDLPEAADVTVEVIDATGRTVATLSDGPQPAGTLRAEWDTARAATGVYVVRVRAGGQTASQTVAVVR